MKLTLKTQLRYTLLFLLSFSFAAHAQDFLDLSQTIGFDAKGQNRGVSIADFDQDGLEDIYVSRLYGANLLFKNKGDFQFEEVSAQYGVRDTSNTNCSVWFDLENDGDLDLFLVNNMQPNKLFRNDGAGFTDVSDEFQIGTTANPKSVHAVDYDNDGFLDIYVANVLDQNILWKNQDGESLINVTESVGIDDTGRSLGAIFFDYDLDGDQDLFQTRDGIDPNLFYRNDNGVFTEVSAELGLDYNGLGMGADVTDLNDDGRPDIYLTNLYENKLYLSNESGAFDEVSESAGVDDIGMGWSTIFFDCDLDGTQDIYLANDSYFGVNGISPIKNRMFVNQGDMTFTSANHSNHVQNEFGTYGAAAADFDLDGRVDLAMANSGNSDGNQIFQNLGQERNYVTIALKGVESNSMGIGSRVELHSGETVMVDYTNAGSGYSSQNSPRSHFGLGDISIIDSIVILWPSGIRQIVEQPLINKVHVIEENTFFVPAGQVIWTEPMFPTQTDQVTVFFNAAEGNGALAGFTGDVYAHTGLITDESNSPSDWQHVIGNWGTADSRVLMTKEDTDIYSISYKIDEFYGVGQDEEVLQLAFVFRNVDGSIVGRDSDGSDIFTDVVPAQSGLFVSLISPGDRQVISIVDSLSIRLESNEFARFVISDNDDVIFDDSTTSVDFFLKPNTLGIHSLLFDISNNSDTLQFERTFFALDTAQIVLDAPSGIRDGVNYMGDTAFIFQLTAPGKNFVYFLCPENEYFPDSSFRMNRSTDGNQFWIELPKDIFENRRNAYTYFFEETFVTGDPYAELVLDPWNDPFVDDEIMAGLPDHPGTEYGPITAFDLEQEEYPWEVENFEKPQNTDLVIYELLMRDFLQDHSYVSLIDTLDYLEKLGVNAIELMPIQEFEGNQSWGYNPSHHLAVDKYYGSREQLKQFIDEAHKRGIVVILDVVFNHAFSQSPLVRMYFDLMNFRPLPTNPWLNVTARHPFNVGYDFNHESLFTKEWTKRNLQHWIEKFHFDGFRFDLSKGMTQKNSGNDAGLMSQYDASRIAILKDYADYIWSLDSTSYVILEHFADNSEEKELAEYGMMLWGNMNHGFSEAAMGYSSDLEGLDYTHRGWGEPHLIGYMESHDEERMMYRLLNFGNSDGNYSTRNFATALQRVEAASAIFYTVPGPKMLWEFGELGYEFSINRCTNGTINDNCRLDPKPIRWDYVNDWRRDRLRRVISDLIHLKTNYPTFSTEDFTFNDANLFIKTVDLRHPEMDALVLANYRVVPSNFNPRWPYVGTWYEYFSGDSLIVNDINDRLDFEPGEYRIYTSKRITPPSGFVTRIRNLPNAETITISPNPVYAGDQIWLDWGGGELIDRIEFVSISGQRIEVEMSQQRDGLRLKLPGDISPGTYFVHVISDRSRSIGKVIILN